MIMTAAADTLAGRMQAEAVARRIESLKSHEVIPQNSEQWIQARRVLLTASELASFLTCEEDCAREYVEAFGLQDSFRYSKRCASPWASRKQTLRRKQGIIQGYTESSVTAWGHLFEPTLRTFFQYLHGGKEVLEFGLITSPFDRSSFLAASPDGVCPELGAVVELKAPHSRDISSSKAPSFHYWTQMQCQMECLDLPRAYYLEASITAKYMSEEDYLNDELEDGEHKGCLVSQGPRSSVPAPLELWTDHAGQLAWAKETSEREGGTVVFFKIVHFNEFVVHRSKPWLSRVLPRLKDAFNELIRFDHAKAQMELEEEMVARKSSSSKRRRLSPPVLPELVGDMCGGGVEEED